MLEEVGVPKKEIGEMENAAMQTESWDTCLALWS